MAQGQGYTVKAIEPVAIGSEVQARLFTLAPGEVIPWHFHSAVTDWYFVLEGTLSIETRAPADRRELAVGGTYHIAPKTAHLISNRSEADTRFLLVQGVGPYDFLKVLRSHHRAWYGLSEMIVAFALMYVVYFPHGGPSLLAGGGSVPSFLDVVTSRAVTFFGSVYALVRGCDNIVSG